ncbi:MAG: UbiA family prenyltransferase [Candidatus Thermoplasmatota archaeon]
MKKILAIWQLMRLEHGVMLALAILVGSLIAGTTFPAVDKFLLTFCTALFLEASTFALNDYFDYSIDKKNNRTDRPLVRGDISPRTALLLFAFLFPLGILASYFVNLTCFVIAVVTALFAVVYDMVLKKRKLVGNFFIAYIMAIPFVFGGAAVLPDDMFSVALPPAILVVAVIAFLAGAGREIMKDVMDFEGDKIFGVKSFPAYIGIRASNGVAAMFYIAAVLLSFVPFFVASFEQYYFNVVYFLPIFITDTMLLSTSLQLLLKKNVQMKMLRTFTLVALFIGLLGFLVSSFFRWS